MNIRQIRLLNQLESEQALIKAELEDFRETMEEAGQVIAFLLAEVERLKNPPKRPVGRPRKVNVN